MKKQLISVFCAVAMACSIHAAALTVFTDVHPADWYYDAVNHAVSNNLFNGTSATMFSPSQSMTRGMFVTVLGRMAEVDTESYTGTSFSDVPTAAYYAPYISWANDEGFVSGTGNGRFSPDAPITREQIAKMLFTYAQNLQIDTSTDFIPDKYYDYTDYRSVSRYVTNAVSWCVNKGIINGSNGKINPQDTATRAEVATMLMNAEPVLNDKGNTNEPDEQPILDAGLEDTTNNGDTNDNEIVTDEIDQRPTGQSAVDEYGGYWDYDLSNATFDAINDLREQNGLNRFAYSLQVQEWADIRSRELVGAYDDKLYDAHMRPDGSVFATVGKGCNTENALLGLATTTAQENLNKWYASTGHRENMLNTRSKTAAVSIYVRGQKVYAIQLFNILTVEELNDL